MRNIPSIAFALLLALPAAASAHGLVALVGVKSAEGISLVHSYPGVKITVHIIPGQIRPDAVTYEGAQGRYLITWADLSSIKDDRGPELGIYNLYSLEPTSLCYRYSSADTTCESWPYSNPAIVGKLSALVDELAKKGKKPIDSELRSAAAELTQSIGVDKASLAKWQVLGSARASEIKEQVDALSAATKDVRGEAADASSATAESNWVAARVLARTSSRLGDIEKQISAISLDDKADVPPCP